VLPDAKPHGLHAPRAHPGIGVQAVRGSPDVYPGCGLWNEGEPARGGAESIMPKILLAEDDTDMRRFLVKALQNAGFDVISYDNGLSAYQRLREEPFELLLTDIVMPEMDGAPPSSIPTSRSCSSPGSPRWR
jgi:hypothetical protein